MARIRTVTLYPDTAEDRWKEADLRFKWPTVGLYRMYDAEGALLYVGITNNPVMRWRSHARQKPWWPYVARIELETFTDEFRALDAERDAIKSERPLFNKRSAVLA